MKLIYLILWYFTMFYYFLNYLNQSNIYVLSTLSHCDFCNTTLCDNHYGVFRRRNGYGSGSGRTGNCASRTGRTPCRRTPPAAPLAGDAPRTPRRQSRTHASKKQLTPRNRRHRRLDAGQRTVRGELAIGPGVQVGGAGTDLRRGVLT